MRDNRVFLIRHAHSLKNVRDQHGGPGSEITEQGQLEINALSTFLISVEQVNHPEIHFTNKPQAASTARMLSSKLDTSAQTDPRIDSLNLGVLGGLSREEAARRYPEPAERLEEWRKGLCKIQNLNIPEAEPFDHFWARGMSFLEEEIHALDSGEDLIVVGTRSILILLENILLQNTELENEEYKVFHFDNSAVTKCLLLDGLNAKLIYHNNTSFLANNR